MPFGCGQLLVLVYAQSKQTATVGRTAFSKSVPASCHGLAGLLFNPGFETTELVPRLMDLRCGLWEALQLGGPDGGNTIWPICSESS